MFEKNPGPIVQQASAYPTELPRLLGESIVPLKGAGGGWECRHEVCFQREGELTMFHQSSIDKLIDT